MRTIRLRDVEIGSGSPKVIVPIVGKNRGEILTKAQELTNIPLHVVEWRADFYQDVNDLPSVLSTLRALREALGNIPILFTFRTRKEGGERELPLDRYTQLNLAAALSGDVDAVDVEIFSGDSVVRGEYRRDPSGGQDRGGFQSRFSKNTQPGGPDFSPEENAGYGGRHP